MTTIIKDTTDIGLEDQSLFRQQMYIDGQWSDARNGASKEVNNPATNTVLGTIPDCTQEDVTHAIDAAAIAFKGWSATVAKERARILRRWFELIMENQEDLARIMTAEQGKPLKEARGEVAYGASFIEWYAEEAKRVYGETLPTYSPDRRLLVIKQPIGVTAAITPWNFPSAMITRKAAPALASGCTMVVKPSNETPYSALALCELAERAGIPKGVISVVTGDPRMVGKELTTNPTIRKITFTGSTAVGKLLMAQSASTVKKVSMELGGNAPFIVFDDADIKAAVEGLIASKFRNTGQTCVCANRILVQAGIHDKFVAELVKATEQLKVGDGFDESSTQGPLISTSAVEKVEEHIQDALTNGGKLASGGNRSELGGSFFEPTVVTGVTTAMKVAREETFGPFAPIFKFDTEEQAVQMANDTEFGLASYLFTTNLSRVLRVSEELEYGIVSVNTGIFSSESFPFGGIKESGIGREGSRHGMDDYLELKHICIAGV